MKVSELKEAIKSVPDEATVVFVDGDTGKNYTPDEIQVGFVRTAHYKTSEGMESDELLFDKNMEPLRVSYSDMKRYSIDHYRVDYAVRIE